MELKSVGGYIRVSTQEQSQRGLSLESQKADIEDYCRRHGYQLTKLYIDRGITARKNLYKRVAFMEMMQDVQDHKINHIVILRLDRWFRNVYDYHRMMHEYLDPNNCGWSAVKEDYDTTTTNGRLMINLRLSIAEQECDQDSDRIKDIFANRVKDGFVITGTTPIGYKIENKRLVPDEQADITKYIFDTFISVQSVRKTMVMVNAQFNISLMYKTVKSILKNTIYIGKYRDNNNYCQPIIDTETFNRVQDGLEKNIRMRNNGSQQYIFPGLIRCACCGYSMYGTWTHNGRKLYKYYRCDNAHLNRRCENHLMMSEEKLEKYLLDNINDELKDYIVDVEAKEKKQLPIIGNRKQIQSKIDRLTDLFVNGVIDMAELKQRKAELESQIVEDVVPQKTDMTAINAFLNSGFENVYAELTTEEKALLWRSIIKEVQVEYGKVKSIIFL